MAILEGTMDFGSLTITTSNTATASTNVFDAGVAKNLFAGPGSVKITGKMTLTAGSSTLSMRAQFVGSDAATLDDDVEILADTGAILNQEDGDTALTNTSARYFSLRPVNQRVAKRYYGVIFTLGGTSPSAVCTACAVLDDQSNQLIAKASTP